MSRAAGTIEQLARILGEALAMLEQRLAGDQAQGLLDALGVRLPPGATGQGALAAALNATIAEAAQLGSSVAALAAALQGTDAIAVVQHGAEVIQRVGGTIGGIGQIRTAIVQVAAGRPTLERDHIEAATSDLPARLVNFLLVEWIEAKAPALVPALALSGVLDDTPLVGAPGNPSAPPFRRRQLRLDRIGDIATDPQQHLAALYGWGTPAFDGLELFHRIKRFVDQPDLGVMLITPPGLPAILEAWAFRLAVDPTVGPPGLTLRVRTPATIDTSDALPLIAPWSLALATRARFEGGAEATIRPDGGFALRPPFGNASLGVEAALAAGDGTTPMVLFGEAGASRIEMTRFRLGFGLAAEWNNVDAAVGEPTVTLGIEGGHAVIDTSKGDSFLRYLTGGVKGESNVTLSARWSPTGGLKIDGSSAIEIAIPCHGNIGPVTLGTIYLSGGIAAGGRIPIELSAAISGSLGPLAVSIDRVGVLVEGSFPPDGDGNLGPLDIAVAFKPPEGVGLGIDAGGFRGGGFLRLDEAKSEYEGTLELSFQDMIDLKAVGVLTTRMPDGGAGFSLVIVISAEFRPMELGFGFTLEGVGGLIGLNRTIVLDVLRGGLLNGTLNSILFPRDVVANASRIINDLKRIFPPMAGRFLYGPMAKLGWGRIVSLEVGLLIEIPRPGLAIVGVLRVHLPTAEAPLIRIQVNFLGTVDFEKGQLAFDAALYDSAILTMPLTGDMAVRLFWGDNANLLLTVGGFHPAFTPPPLGLGPLSRITLQIFSGLPDIRAEVYFAITANTVQFGGKLELKAGVSIFNVYGFLAVDTLIRPETLHFVTDVTGMLAVRTGTKVLFAVRLALMLEGPLPWHARGRASFEIGFVFTITFTVKFDVTVGSVVTVLLPLLRLLPRILAAFEDDRAWQALPAALHAPQVTLRDLTGEAEIIFHPAGVLTARQRIAPLNLPLQRIGAQRLEGGTLFTVTEIRVGGEIAPKDATKEQFAPAQFLDMSDAEKLSSQSFAAFDAGVAIDGGDAPRTDFLRQVDIVYEVIYLNRPARPIFHKLAQALRDVLVLGSAAAKSALGFTRKAPTGLGTPKMVLEPERFAVVAIKDLTLAGESMVFATQAQAQAAMKGLGADAAGRLQVVPAYEVAA